MLVVFSVIWMKSLNRHLKYKSLNAVLFKRAKETKILLCQVTTKLCSVLFILRYSVNSKTIIPKQEKAGTTIGWLD